ncbi:MAG: hypothetical protein M3N93_13340 [Acidobacteriota bacterium]|nr:hypothetical protein [Acidobacteriota bacterium]
MPETVHLAPRPPLRIEYTAPAMRQIRERACEGLIAAPRVAFGVGGLLLGVVDKQDVRLLESIEIPCSHSAGPSFQLNADEMREAREMIAEAEAASRSGSSRVSVIGWYCSRTRGDVRLSETDLHLFDELFPAPGAIALVVRPDASGPMRAAFFYRNHTGAIVDGLECLVHESDPETPRETRLADILEVAAADIRMSAARHITNPETSAVSSFEFLQSQRRRRQLLMALGIAAAVLVLALVGYFTSNAWLPRPPLAFTSTEEDGSLLIRWNPEALRGIDHASLLLNDGGQAVPATIPLDKSQLISGLFIYMPKSLRVTAKMDAGEITGITAWFATPKPATPKPAPPRL